MPTLHQALDPPVDTREPPLDIYHIACRAPHSPAGSRVKKLLPTDPPYTSPQPTPASPSRLPYTSQHPTSTSPSRLHPNRPTLHPNSPTLHLPVPNFHLPEPPTLHPDRPTLHPNSPTPRHPTFSHLPASQTTYPTPQPAHAVPRQHLPPTLSPQLSPVRPTGHRCRRALAGKSRRRRAYPQQIVTTRLLYCLQDPFAQLSRLQRI